MTRFETRLRRLERAVVDPVNAVTVEWPPEGEPPLRELEGIAEIPQCSVEWPPEGEPPLRPGWHPDLGLFVMRWPEHEEVREEKTA